MNQTKASSSLQDYLLAVVLCCLAIAIARPLDAPSSSFLLAIMVSSLFGGRGPGLLSIAISGVAFDFFFLPPQYHFQIEPASYLRFGVFLGTALLTVAVTEAKRRAEESRREMHAHYRVIADTAPDAIITIDEEARIRFMNPATSRMFGWAPSELMGQPVTMVVPEFRLAARQSSVEWMGKRKDGGEFAVELSFGSSSAGDQSTFIGFVRDISERKAGASALQKSELFLAEAQRLSKTGSFGWNANTGELFWSQEMRRITGLDPDENPTIDLLNQRIHPDDRAAVGEIMDTASRLGEPLDFEHRFLLPDGSVKNIHVLAHAVKDDAGHFRYFGAAMDVTARVQAQEKLERTQAYLVEAEKLSHTGSWMWDVRRHGPAYWSDEMFCIHGRDRALGPPTTDEYRALRAPEDWQQLMQAIDNSVRHKTDMGCDSRLVLPDGSIRYTHIVGHPMTNAAGEVVEIVGTTVDITEQHNARVALEDALEEVRRSEGRLRRILNTVPALVWSARPDGFAEYFNEQWLAYTGFLPGQVLDRGWTAAVHPEDRKTLEEYWDAVLASGDAGEMEARLRRHDGQYRWFLFRLNPLRDESGSVVKWYGTNTDIEDRKLAEEGLRASEHNFRLIVDSIPGLVHTMTANGEVELVSRQILKFFGKTREQFREWKHVLHPEDRLPVATRWRHSVETGQAFDMELRVLRADGVYRWFHSRGLPLRDDEGNIVRWYNLLTDIEDRKRAEEALRKSELTFRQIVDSIPGLVCTLDAKGEVELVNQQMLKYFAKSLDELKDWYTLIYPEERAWVMNAWKRAVETQQVYEIEHRLLGGDGTYRWFHIRSLPLRDSQDQSVRWYTLLTDVDDRKTAEEALRASEREMALIIETIPALVWCASAEGALSYVNRRVLHYVGKDLSALADAGWVNFIHPDDEEATMRTWLHAVSTGESHEVQYRLRRADGVYRWFHVVGQPTRDSEGRVTRWYGLLLDIEDRKNAEEALRTTQARLSRASQIATVGELAASIAHEVNQPLSAVVANGHACLRWLVADPPNLAKAHQAAERIVRDGKEAGEVVRRIRALYKRAALENVPLNLNEVIGEVLTLLNGETTRRRIAVEIDLERGLAPVAGDRVQLQQLLLNLLLNGIEAMDPVVDGPKRLVVRSRQQDSESVLVEIHDCGIGLKDPDKAFEAFFTTKANGMGMGLAICRSIIDAHNGRLWAVSGEARGTTFRFTLPVLAGTVQ